MLINLFKKRPYIVWKNDITNCYEKVTVFRNTFQCWRFNQILHSSEVFYEDLAISAIDLT